MKSFNAESEQAAMHELTWTMRESLMHTATTNPQSRPAEATAPTTATCYAHALKPT